MKEITVKRRLDMVKKRSMGLSLQQTVKELQGTYDVSKQWLYQDWKDRHKWLPAILDLSDTKRLYWDLVAFHNQIKEWAVLQYLKADNSNAAIGALRLLRDLNLDFSELIITRDALARIERLEKQR